jgi:hypothetical protein
MTVTVSTDWSFRDLRTLIVENALLRVVIMPELGAKIWQITYKPKGKDLLWHHPRIKPRKLPFHAGYDDNFFGGWDELFPNDMPEELNGEPMPDHGEVWTLPWEYALERCTAAEATIHLWVETPISAHRVEKWLTLRSGEPILRFHHKVTNLGPADQPYLWKLHPAMAIDEHCRIELGAGTMYVEDFGPPRGAQTGVTYQWPCLVDAQGRQHDMRAVLSRTARVNEFQYATELPEGWCALTNLADRIGFALTFDRNIFSSCWLFATYGGWRDLYTVVLEPCTGYPVSVSEGVRRGTHRILAAGETVECDVTAIVFEGTSAADALKHRGAARLQDPSTGYTP